MIIAVDYDGTLEYSGVMNEALIRKLTAAQRSGNIVILWTCRSGKRIVEAVNRLRCAGFKPNFINENCPAAVSMLRANPRKIYADIYIDDKNGWSNGNSAQIMERLCKETACDKQQGG